MRTDTHKKDNLSAHKTERKRVEQYNDRWSSYGGNTGILSISEMLSPADLKKFEIFQEYDDKFLAQISPDISVAVWKENSVLFEEGAYIDLAFFVVRGKVEVYLQSLGHGGAVAKPIFDQARTMVLGVNQSPEVAPEIPQSKRLPPFQAYSKSGKEIPFLSTIDFNLPRGKAMHLSSGEIFGEIGAMSGWPQSVTARTVNECTLVQIRVPALRSMKRKSPALKSRIDKLYRERSLVSQLEVTPMLANCKPIFVDALKEVVDLVSCEPGEVVVREGDPADALYIVRSGFLKLLQKFSEGDILVSYLSKGMSFGETELLLGDKNGWEMTVASVEFTELVKIPRDVFQNLLRIHPDIKEHLWKTAGDRIKEAGFSKRNMSYSEFTKVAVDTGLVQANSLLVIDLDTCIRCDDCVRACADTHDGRARFIREGDKYGNLQIAKSCYHCRDPVCLVGCPTGAIHRAGVGQVVEIDDSICIGCSVCANNCPYDAIVMHETGGVWPDDMIPVSLQGNDRLVASKCDLCYDTGHGPACTSNCPQGCAFRVGSIEEFQALVKKQEPTPVGSKTGLSKGWKKSSIWRGAFILAAVISGGGFLLNMAISEVRSSNIWGLTYGYAAALFLVSGALLGLRRRIMRLATKYRLGQSNTWSYLHVYGAMMFLLLMLMHSSFHLPTGALNSGLWGLSIWVVLSGLAGLGLQKWIPKVLTSGLSIEVHYDRIPELINEIRQRAEKVVESCEGPVKSFCKGRILPAMKGPNRRFIYFVDITGGLQAGLRDSDYLHGFLGPVDKAKFDEILELYKTKLRIDAHYTLQQALRWWPYAHIPFAMLLLVFVVLHILSVFYF